jgi:hypothetical protein
MRTRSSASKPHFLRHFVASCQAYFLTYTRYQLEGYAETLVWDIDVMNRHLQKLEIGIEGKEAVGESTQQLMDHMDRRIPDMMNWRKRCVISISQKKSQLC